MLTPTRRKYIRNRAVDLYTTYPECQRIQAAVDDLLACAADNHKLRLMLKMAREGLIEIASGQGQAAQDAARLLECLREVVIGG